MFIYNIKIAFRNFRKHLTINLINLLGISLGITCCLMIYVYIHHELTYNTTNEKIDRISRVVTDIKTPESFLYFSMSPVPLAEALKREYPEVEDVARLQPIQAILKFRGNVEKESDVYLADTSVFNVFTLPLISDGNVSRFSQPNTAVVSRSTARKYFGIYNPIDSIIICNNKSYQVVGVIENLPDNSDIGINILLSENYSSAAGWIEDLPVYSFILFRREGKADQFQKKLESIVNRYMAPAMKKAGAEGYSFILKLQKLKDLHYTEGRIGDTPKGNEKIVYLFSFLALFVITIALLNYINLTTAKAPERAKEVGVRKISGTSKLRLFGQFIMESTLLGLLSVMISIGIIYVLMLLFKDTVTIRPVWFFSMNSVYVIVAILFLILMSGLYPAFILTEYKPIEVLKGRFSHTTKGILLRRVFTTFQFILTIGMIAGVIIIFRQMKFLTNFNLGLNKDHIVTIRLPEDSVVKKSARAFADVLKQQSEVIDVSVGSNIQPGGQAAFATTLLTIDGKKKDVVSNYLFIDDHFLKMMGIRIRSGRNITSDPADQLGAFIVNQAFLKHTGLSNGLGVDITAFDHKGKIVGIVDDFHYRSIHNLVEPLVMIYNTSPPEHITVKLESNNVASLKDKWQKLYPGYPFDYFFLDESFEKQYENDRSTATVFTLFTVLIALISFFGLYALLSVNIFQRTKEIGIRVVLGASGKNISILMFRDYLIILFVAIMIAAPITWILMNKWLEEFAYRNQIQWWIFAVAGIVTLIISSIIVFLKVFKVIVSNPVNALRTE